jgi:hypothetical protein
MANCWTDWNRGMDDAYAYLRPQAGMPGQYYQGYDYGCALTFECIADVRPAEIAEDEGVGVASG